MSERERKRVSVRAQEEVGKKIKAMFGRNKCVFMCM